MAFTPDFIDSFDNYPTSSTLQVLTQKWASANSTGNAFLTSGGRGGSMRYHSTSTVALVSKVLGAHNIRTTGFAFMLNANTNAMRTLLQLRNGTTNHVDVRATSASGSNQGPWNITVTRNGTLIGTVATQVTHSVWNHLCLKVQLSATAGRVILLLNGGEELNFTGVTQNGATTTINTVTLAGTQMSYDDFYTGASDDSSSSLTDMLGDIRVAHLRPDSAGASTDFTPSTSDANWEIAAQTPNMEWEGADGPHVHSHTPGHLDLYGLENPATPAIAVHAVAPYIRARKDDAGARTGSIVTRSGSTNYASAPITMTESYNYYQQIHLVDPDTSAAWTPSAVDNLQVGPKVES